MKARQKWHNSFKVQKKEENRQPIILNVMNVSLRNVGGIKVFSD